VIYLDGSIHQGRAEDEIGAHCLGKNATSIGICYIGGLNAYGKPKDTRTDKQKAALLTLLKKLKQKYPKAKVYGHRDFAKRDCPCFDVKEEYKDL
jgi:N-acetylmuramoyl-L-alanine amidase